VCLRCERLGRTSSSPHALASSASGRSGVNGCGCTGAKARVLREAMMHWALVEALRKLEIPIAKPMCTPTATQDNTRDSPSLHKTPQPPPVAFRDSSTYSDYQDRQAASARPPWERMCRQHHLTLSPQQRVRCKRHTIAYRLATFVSTHPPNLRAPSWQAL
jgi:hypothetical protein